MKSIVFLFSLLTLLVFITSRCTIKEGEDKCCWLNSNGCCKPPKRGQGCTMAFRTCCKVRVFDEKTQTYKIEYK